MSGLLARDAVLGPAAAPARELVVATGVDRIRFLHGLVTGNVAGTEPGRGCRAALLTPKGQVVSDLRIFVRPDDVRIVVDAGQAAPLATALARYAIMDDFAAAPVPEFSFVLAARPDGACSAGGRRGRRRSAGDGATAGARRGRRPLDRARARARRRRILDRRRDR